MISLGVLQTGSKNVRMPMVLLTGSVVLAFLMVGCLAPWKGPTEKPPVPSVTVEACIPADHVINVSAFLDTNSNGVRDSEDLPLEGIEVTITTEGGETLIKHTPAIHGFYSCGNTPDDPYPIIVRVTPPTNYTLLGDAEVKLECCYPFVSFLFSPISEVENLFLTLLNMEEMPENIHDFQGRGSSLYPGVYIFGYFRYEAEPTYFDLLMSDDRFTQESEFNEKIHEVDCLENDFPRKIYSWTGEDIDVSGKICLRGTIFPYDHYILYDPQSQQVIHFVEIRQ